MKNANHLVAIAVLFSAMLASLSAGAAEGTTEQEKININTATVTELSYLPGVGHSKAEAIVKHRTNRQFKKVEDLMRVKGIGRKTFKKMRPYLALKGQTTVKGKIRISK